MPEKKIYQPTWHFFNFYFVFAYRKTSSLLLKNRVFAGHLLAPANIYLFKVNGRSISERCEIC